MWAGHDAILGATRGQLLVSADAGRIFALGSLSDGLKESQTKRKRAVLHQIQIGKYFSKAAAKPRQNT